MLKNCSFKVLIVEDDYFIMEDIVRSLEELGHTVVGEAANGADAVEKTVALKPDIILMDIELPGVNGLEAAATIQVRQPTPIIFLTAYDLPVLVEKAIKVGASAYLIKPVDTGEIQRALAIAVARHHDIREIQSICDKKQEKVRSMEEIMLEIDALRGMIPICCFCKKICDSQTVWQEIETFISSITGASFTHGICPECLKSEYNLSNPK